MIEAIGQSRTPESPKPKEKLSDERLGDLLSAVGNHEAKAITLILMRSGKVFDRSNLYGEVLSSQGESKKWRVGWGDPFKYCRNSLAPIGLVAKKTLSKDLSTYGYQITEDGKELGIPLGGVLLDFSERHNIPLKLFGHTTSFSKSKTVQTEGEDIEFKKRLPLATLKILYELLTSPSLPIREVDLVKRMGIDRGGLLLHLTRLSKLGVIKYDSREANKPYAFYKSSSAIVEGELPIFRGEKALTQSVFGILKARPDQYLTAEDAYNFLPKEQKEKWKNKKTLCDHISNILSFLARHKYIDIGRFHRDKQSEINITDDQKAVFFELLEIMHGFQNQDPEVLARGRRIAVEIISNPKRVSNLMRRAKEASGNANKSSKEETQKIILTIILSNPGITNKGIQKLLEEQYKKTLSVNAISCFSHLLLKAEAIRAERQGSANRFYSNSKPPATP